MFKFLFGKKDKAPEVKVETQRETVIRAQNELNEILTTLSPKARITVCPEDGSFEIDLPEQMPDEALALPSPVSDAASADTEASVEDTSNAASRDAAESAAPEQEAQSDPKSDTDAKQV